jgi:hypothetical protein
MRDLRILFVHVIVTLARLARPGGLRSLVAESTWCSNRQHACTDTWRCVDTLHSVAHCHTHTGGSEVRSEDGVDLGERNPRSDAELRQVGGTLHAYLASAGTMDVACAILMLCPSELIRAGHSGQITRMLLSHCSSIPRKRRGREYATVPI